MQRQAATIRAHLRQRGHFLLSLLDTSHPGDYLVYTRTTGDSVYHTCVATGLDLSLYEAGHALPSARGGSLCCQWCYAGVCLCSGDSRVQRVGSSSVWGNRLLGYLS